MPRTPADVPDLPEHGPRPGDHVQVETTAEVVELLTLGGVAGAVVELAPAACLVLDGRPDGITPPRVWLPLHALVLLRSTAS